MVDTNGNKLRGKEALKESIRLGVEAGERISKILKSPQDLEYEKTFSPFILISKKRYVGNKYEHDINKYKQTSMGIVLKRRDNATILKIIYGGIIDILMKEMKIIPAIDFLQKSLRNLISGKIGFDKLIITKTLNDGYKNPEMIAHKVLAERMGERDPGNKPQLLDRMEYIYKITNGNVKLQGDRIENPDYMIKHNIKPDYEYYVTNQIMKPVSQVFALRIEEIPTFKQNKDFYDIKLNNLIKNGMDEELAIKKIINDKQQTTEELLFWDILHICDSQKNGSQSIKNWFS
jgi:DNA polymerase elongation subunit (family B)